MTPTSGPSRQAWYERPAPVFALLVALAFGGFVLLFAWRTFSYYRALKVGDAGGLPQFAGQFTAGRLNAAIAAGAGTSVASPDAPALGAPGATVTIVEFGDFECPYSAEAYPTVRRVAAEHPDQVRLEWRDFPLADLHPHAALAAAAGSCAARQGKFWQMYDTLFADQSALARADLIGDATRLGMDASAFAACLDAGGDKDRIAKDMADGAKAGVRGTPTFFVNGAKIEGAVPYDVLSQIVARLAK